ncbi:threonine transporter RhtB [Shinella yambaruensis]|uniref:Threonine transporter RhtB n=1 Tax=Shinella yambaruensis TaxID=415996 RepID=A0ABQ5ZHQ1_9HYPH|nr:threonine transporter RhtB [Shinella yambaruensis]MCJ8024686.1 threonine transporter RhtB [Shinella yambaruensis]MCU7979139.1 threonine transporter RhtB [Shinella yambaruensis]GLR50966.1 threonine transporter RhtB [Shinella yambaruensis]
MPDSFFVFAILALLLTPGPTNTLLTVGAAARGFRSSLPLLVGELAGYLVVVVPLATIAASLLEGRPALANALRLAAALWVLFLAVRLWRVSAVQEDRSTSSPVTVGQVFLTTVLNPKAPIIGLVIMPHGTLAQIAPAIGLFSLLVAGAGTSFLVLGSLIGRAPVLSPQLVYRVAAVCLGVFSLGLAGTASGLI